MAIKTMAIWIITTGNRDIQLKTDANWTRASGQGLFDLAKEKEPIRNCRNQGKDFISPQRDEETQLFPVPARVLGLAYGGNYNFYSDLSFPLINVLKQKFATSENPKNPDQPNKCYIILTDQSKLFTQSNIINPSCPFWQDTCTLKPILEWYFEINWCITPSFITLKLQNNNKKGLDHWEEVLDIVSKKLEKKIKLDSPDETVYVSHQASTPAISSAVQFVSISLFQKVEFLVSNQYYKDNQRQPQAELIPSSKYSRSLQIQKAKKLITDGFPGSALELLKDIYDENDEQIIQIRNLVNIFNIKDTKTNEFDPNSAIKRVRQSLDLIEYFFKQENYLQGITLLAAAQETFLKATIVQHLKQHYSNNFKEWNEKGIFLKNITGNFKIIADQVDTITAGGRGPKPPGNTWTLIKDTDHLLYWVHELKNTNVQNYWNLLIWSCTYFRDHNSDRRNQLMHNLRGVQKKEVILYITDPQELEQYLQDTPNYSNSNIDLNEPVNEVYNREVKSKFITALINLCGFDENSYESLESKINGLSQSL